MKQSNAIYTLVLIGIIGTAFIALLSIEDAPVRPGPVIVDENATFSGIIDIEEDSRFHTIRVTDNVTRIHFVLNCPGVDFDLYGSLGKLPSIDEYEILGYDSGGEDFYYEDPEPGIWHLMVHSYSGTGQYDLIIEFEYE